MADDSCRLPSIVQELAATVKEPPSRYLLPEQERLGDQQLVGAEMPEPVPCIDLRRLLASDGAEDEATKLRSALQSWGDLLHDYTLNCKRVKDDILRAMAKILELDDDCLINHFGEKGSTYARFNYYPACPRPDLVLGIRPHSDVCALTLLLMDKDVGGLQVLRDETWYSVPPVRDYALLVNVGVSLENKRRKKIPRNPMSDESWRLPTIVQELAATVKEPPSRYLLPEQERLGDQQLVGAEMPEPVPCIDLRQLLASDGAEEEAAKLRSVLQSWGFFLVTNHGIETSLIDAVITASREFFRQPLEQKQEYSNLVEGKQWQLEGYGNDPVKTQDQILDWSDRLHLRVEPEDERNFARWPRHPEPFRDLLHEYTLDCKRVKDGILRAMAKLLELDDDCLINQFGEKGSTYARFNYYPACPRPDLVLGIKAHSDVGVLTLLLMDKHVGGLQVLRDGTWYSVPPVRDYALLVNVGMSMEIMTNGIFRGPVHRVVTNSEKERMSVAMFYAADLEKEIEPIAELLDEKQPLRYKKIKCKDFVYANYEYLSKRERVIESLKI
ncbi:hypothetical protein EJB05_52048, partial [Eragrostis curvula]